ncbi:MAG: hypothetical protein B6U88_00855 [Candidatus Aenigmarchaeota archaeon ex4484_56]|nr:MAG: hypothetical protein B6U88_00855 [Candidatus Aenigmarchaeota archaeon ex4484_56]
MNKEIKVNTSGEAWIKNCEYILKYGKKIRDADKNLLEITNFVIYIEDFLEKDYIIKNMEIRK